MNRAEFERAVSSKTIPSVLLFEGEEEQLKQEALSLLRNRLLPDGLEELNETVLDNPDTDLLIASSETIPFMADRRLVIVRDYPALTGRGEADEKLLTYLPAVPETTVLLFFCIGKPDSRRKLYSAIKKTGGIVTFSVMKGSELTGYVIHAFEKHGKECPSRVAEFLLFTSGSDAGLLQAEVAKVSSYIGERIAVTAEDVSAIATPSAECTVFQMADAVVSGQKSRAFSLLKRQLAAGTERLNILALLLRQYRMMQHIKIMQYEKKPPEFIRSAIGVPPFALDQYRRQASAYSGGQIKKAVQLCLNTEYGIKSGQLLQDSALEAVILKMLALRQKD